MHTMDWLSRSKLAYGSLCFGLSLLSVFFNYYHIAVFQEVYHTEKWWLNFAQILYLVLNSFSDVVLSYFQDNVRYFRFTATRRACITYCSPLLVFVFVMTWFSWGRSETSTGFHLLAILVFWDVLLTSLCLTSSCLFTEISKKPTDRLQLLWVARASALLGTFGVLLHKQISESLQEFFKFQITAIIVAIISLLLLNLAGHRAYTEYDMLDSIHKSSQTARQNGLNNEMVTSKDIYSVHQVSYVEQIYQLFSCRNFKIFVAVNFFQELHRTFHSNFFPTICDQLLPEQTVPWETRSSIYGSVNILANLLLILGIPAVSRVGYYKVIRASFVYKICGGVVMLSLGPNICPILTTCIIWTDSCLNQASFAMFCLPLSEIVDIDARKHSRSHPITSVIYGMNSFLVKPAFWLSPVLLMTLFKKYGFDDLKNEVITAETHEGLKHVMFYCACLYPIILGIAQFFLWSLYKSSNIGHLDAESQEEAMICNLKSRK